MERLEVSFLKQGEGDAISSTFSALDPTWEAITTLFPGHTGMKILLAILASAEIIQQTLPIWGLVDVAILNCRNLATFAQQLGCGKDTLLRYIKVYQTLGLLTHSRTWRQRRSTTELTLPLTPYHPSSEILERLNMLVSQGRKKQQELARFVRDRYLLLYRLPLYPHQETQVEESPVFGLLTRTAHLLQKRRVRRIERQILHEEITEVLAQMERDQQGDVLATIDTVPLSFQRSAQCDHVSHWKDQDVHQEDRSAGNELREDLTCQKGDLPVMDVEQQEDPPHEEGDLVSQKGELSFLSVTKPGDARYDMGDLHAGTMAQLGDLTSYHGDFSAHDGKETVNVGDLKISDTQPSSIDSVCRQKDSSQNEFELELKIGEQWTGSEDELSQEAAWYLRLLDGPEYATPDYLNTHAGKKALGGYKNKIRRSPRLARVAAINTILQRTFYDLTKQKKPLESAGRWFHSSFDRYADPVRPMEILGEIVNWAKSPYTLEEIALVLPLERKRQETQWWSSEPLHRPFASCVALYHHLPDTISEIQERENRETFPSAITLSRADTPLELSTFQRMNAIEAEQLADEITQEACWYLENIQVHPNEAHLDGNTYVVKASIVNTLFPVAYRTRHDWLQEHQHQVRHRMREQQRGEIYAAHPS